LGALFQLLISCLCSDASLSVLAAASRQRHKNPLCL